MPITSLAAPESRFWRRPLCSPHLGAPVPHSSEQASGAATAAAVAVGLPPSTPGTATAQHRRALLQHAGPRGATCYDMRELICQGTADVASIDLAPRPAMIYKTPPSAMSRYEVGWRCDVGDPAGAVGSKERSLVTTWPCSVASGPDSASGLTSRGAMPTGAGGVRDE